MITVAVTGGIGAGKSTATTTLASLGAVVVDSDQIAREVVAPGTPGLAAVAEEFGPGVLDRSGALDRAALAALVFADADARHRLEGITHPLIRARFRQIRDTAADDSVVVNDIPLVRDVPAAAEFHLTVGVGAPLQTRVARLVGRGLAEPDARARIASQITDAERRPLCDVWLDNAGRPEGLADSVTRLWDERIRPFAANVARGERAGRSGPVLEAADPTWVPAAALLAARVSAAAGGARVEHVGSTAVPGLPAKDVIDLQLAVPSLDAADGLAARLAAAGFVRIPGIDQDNPHPAGDDAAGWRKRFHANCDPGRAVNLHVRVRGLPNWRLALLLRDWLRADRPARAEYGALKAAAAARFARDPDTERYAEAKEPWFAAAAVRAERWATATGWAPG